MIVKLLTEHHLEFLSLNGGYRGSSKSTLVKMSNCWKSNAAVQIFLLISHGRSAGCSESFMVANLEDGFFFRFKAHIKL